MESNEVEFGKAMPFTFSRLANPDLILIEAKVFVDERGFFTETFKRSEFLEHGIPDSFVQDNHSRSSRGVLRGLHYQKPPAAQAKLVSVIRGEIFDVVVDIRKRSPFYGRWTATVLSDQNHRSLFVPEGFAHGFLILSEEADVVYNVTAEYSAEHERGIMWNDPTLRIAWPIQAPLLSTKDKQLPKLENADNNFLY